MNLFIAGWGVPVQLRQRVERNFSRVLASYPQLDTSTRRTVSHGLLLAICAHTAQRAAEPRVYAYDRDGTLLFYDGRAVDPTGGIEAHRAEQLLIHWERLPERLEGQFAIVRLDTERGSFDLYTDPLGVHEVFYREFSDGCLVSNSARLLASMDDRSGLDLVGASLMLGLDIVGGDQTLNEDVKAVPGGQHWHWDPGLSSPHRSCYFSPAEVSTPSRRELDPPAVTELAETMVSMVRRLGERFPTIRCPITAGRDSRVMVGALMHAGVAASYFTGGNPESADATIGLAIAERFGLSHEGLRPRATIGDWLRAGTSLVEHTDGTVALTHVDHRARRLDAPFEHLSLQLYGAGGELARGYYTPPRRLLEPLSEERAIRSLERTRVRRTVRLLTPFVTTASREHVRTACEGFVEQGFAPRYFADAFYLQERVRRWAGAQFRQIMPWSEVFSPFATRPFLRAAFSLTAGARFREQVHYKLLEHFSPELHAFPFEKPWRPQNPLAFYLGYLPRIYARKLRRRLGTSKRSFGSSREPQRFQWFEDVLPEVRAFCLDRTNSALWHIVHRDAFEALTSPRTPAASRKPVFSTLVAITTLHLYESTLGLEGGSDPT